MVVNVTDAHGKPVTFTPFYGALAHAIFFRAGSLDYFHSHICGNDPACTAGFGTPATTGHSTKPGRLELGVLLPATGRWRLFLQVTHGGKLITAPFTLRCDETSRTSRGTAARPRARGPGRPRAGVCGDADAARGPARRPAPAGDHRRRPRGRRVLSLGVLWLAALGVRERHALSSSPGQAPRLRLARFGADAVMLGGGSLAAFAALETWMHARAGMHMHWWACLEGPVHRNAIPILLALSLAAAALLAASRHALAWARRVVQVLRRLAQPRAIGRARLLARGRASAPAWLLVRAVRVRGPPVLSIP